MNTVNYNPQMPNLPGADGCIFCKIAQGIIPCAKVYEDEAFLAFLDINPFRLGHTLVIPKGHYATLLDFPGDMGSALFNVMQKVGTGILNHTQAQGLNCLQNNFSAAGQVVFHVHWHLIPRHEGDGLFSDPLERYGYGEGGAENFAKGLRDALSRIG